MRGGRRVHCLPTAGGVNSSMFEPELHCCSFVIVLENSYSFKMFLFISNLNLVFTLIYLGLT